MHATESTVQLLHFLAMGTLIVVFFAISSFWRYSLAWIHTYIQPQSPFHTERTISNTLMLSVPHNPGCGRSDKCPIGYVCDEDRCYRKQRTQSIWQYALQTILHTEKLRSGICQCEDSGKSRLKPKGDGKELLLELGN